jgi:hypothetical protein
VGKGSGNNGAMAHACGNHGFFDGRFSLRDIHIDRDLRAFGCFDGGLWQPGGLKKGFSGSAFHGSCFGWGIGDSFPVTSNGLCDSIGSNIVGCIVGRCLTVVLGEFG